MSDSELSKIRREKLRELMNQNKKPSIKIEKLSTVKELDDKIFKTFIKNEPLPIIVDFWAPWCRPCRMAAAYFPELAKDFAGKIRFAKVNVDSNQYIATSFRVTSIPHFIVFYKGKIITRFVGALPQSKMKEKIKSILSKLK